MQYTIKKGDTLSAIAKQYGTTTAALAAQNGIKDPNKIYAGNTLTIGDSPADTETAAPSAYDAFEQGAFGLTTPVYSAPDVSAYYGNAASQYTKAMEAAYQNEKAQLEAQAKALAGEYAQNRKSTYANARLSAIGNNEALAAAGLAGNLYSGAKSGVSESSRVRQDVALRSALSETDRQEQSARDTIAQKIIEAGYTKDTELAKWLAELYIAQANAQQQAAASAYSAQTDAYNSQLSLLQQLFENSLTQQQYDKSNS